MWLYLDPSAPLGLACALYIRFLYLYLFVPISRDWVNFDKSFARCCSFLDIGRSIIEMSCEEIHASAANDRRLLRLVEKQRQLTQCYIDICEKIVQGYASLGDFNPSSNAGRSIFFWQRLKWALGEQAIFEKNLQAIQETKDSLRGILQTLWMARASRS